MGNVVVDVKNLTKKFGRGSKEVIAVDDISFSINEGEIVGLLGPNGAGKSTTIQMLLGLITPTSGTVNIFGKQFENHREEILGRMNFSSTYTHLPWRQSVWENLYVVALLYSVKSPRAKVDEVINLMHLEEVRNTEVGGLSSGWVTRLNLARTFLNDPEFILLDEPTASLDPEAAAQVRTEVMKKRKISKITILWTSHNMAEVEEVCNRVIFLQKGKIIAEDTPENLAKRIEFCRINLMIIDGQKRTLSWCKEQNLNATAAGRYVSVQLKEKEISSFLSKLADIRVEYEEISIDKPTLEDFFISIAKNKYV